MKVSIEMVKRKQMSVEVENNTKISENGKRTDVSLKVGQKRQRIKNLYRQPTVSELNRLHETETLFNSNLFRLQIEEVLQEVKLKEKTLNRFQIWFNQFVAYMNQIPDNDNDYDLSEDNLFKELKVKIPLGEELAKTKCSFKFEKFTDIAVVGSYNLGSSINSNLRVDVQVTMSALIFTKNDSINYKYHKKRAAYLAYLTSYLKKSDIVSEIKYVLINGCESKPYIDLIPCGKIGRNLTVRLFLICEKDTFKLHRYNPNRNNLRETWFFSDETLENTTDIGPSTPYYNSSILSDLTNSINNDFLHKIFNDNDNLKQAVILLKIWLRQRKLDVSGHIVSMFVAYLVQLKRINNVMSSYQIVRNVWISLKSSEWDTKGISLHKGDDEAPIMEDFLKYFPVVFLDKTGFYNICWQMSSGTYNSLRFESSLAVEMLDNSTINSFIPLFMTKYSSLYQFDHIIRFTAPKINDAIYKSITKEKKLNYGVDKMQLILDTVCSILSKGLGERIQLIVPQVNMEFSWPVKKRLEKARTAYNETFTIGLLLNSEIALNLVDKGPPANLPEAEEFRAFWGEKSELRRFQDGSITETCVWEGESLAERRLIVKQIVNYLLKLKFGIESDVFHIADQLDNVLTCKQYVTPDGILGTGEESTVMVFHAFDELRKDLRGLTDIPLEINSVYGTSPVFSYTDPFPPMPQGINGDRQWRRGSCCLIKEKTFPPYIPVMKAILELGHSGKWPSDLQAFRCLKAAFHLQIAENLTKQFSVVTQAYPSYIDVLKEGFIFRLEIAHQKEVVLLRREINNGVVRYKESDETLKMQCDFSLLPRLRSAMHGLHQKYPAYGPAASLTKRWLSSHLLDPCHFPETVIELLVASAFLRPEPFTPPVQPFCAFLRILQKLATTDLASELLVVNFNEELTYDEIIEIEKKFNEEQNRPALYILTPYDGDTPSIWSKNAPTTQVLARTKSLANVTLEYFNESLMEGTRDNVLGAFLPSLDGYDVLIHLETSLVPYECERVNKKPVLEHLTPVTENFDMIPVVEFHPVRDYLEELRSAYSDFALFFHDAYGGDVIAVLWQPHIKETREFQIANISGMKPVEDNGETKYKVNIEALLQDFRILGKGLVRNITVR